MKQLHFGNSNSLYKQEGSACETTFKLVVTGMFQAVYSKGKNVAWQDLGRVGAGPNGFLHKQATLAALNFLIFNHIGHISKRHK